MTGPVPPRGLLWRWRARDGVRRARQRPPAQVLAAVAVPVLLFAGTLIGLAMGGQLPFWGNPGGIFPPVDGLPCTATSPHPPRPYVGVAPGFPWQVSVAAFTRAVGRPSVIESYQRFGAPFNAPRSCAEARLGALQIIQWNPAGVSLAAIAAGRWDGYLARYATTVREYRLPVVISFGHEMNGVWFDWGFGHVPPSVFIAAWRRIHDVFRAQDTRNVTWLWNTNRDTHLSQPEFVSPPGDWWPGEKYVDWLGVDAYFNQPGDTFRGVFSKTLTAFRALSHDPVLITETAVAPGVQAASQVQSLTAGVAAHPRILGFVWFDQDRRQDWNVERDPAAARALAGWRP